jgi:hypothetical protein
VDSLSERSERASPSRRAIVLIVLRALAGSVIRAVAAILCGVPAGVPSGAAKIKEAEIHFFLGKRMSIDTKRKCRV